MPVPSHSVRSEGLGAELKRSLQVLRVKDYGLPLERAFDIARLEHETNYHNVRVAESMFQNLPFSNPSRGLGGMTLGTTDCSRVSKEVDAFSLRPPNPAEKKQTFA